jgi:tetratricopeptide (TPR) repeat protein
VERTKDRAQLDLRDAFAAFESALERGDLGAARAVAYQTLDMSRDRLPSVGDTPQALRDLSISLSNVGRVEGDLGNLGAARIAYHECLKLAHRLREARVAAPQALRDLSIALDSVGETERDLGNLETARNAYRESLELSRRLAQTFPDQPQYQRNLAWIEARIENDGAC